MRARHWLHTLFLLAACGRSPVLSFGGGGGAGGRGREPAREDAGDDDGDSVQTCEQVDFLFVIDNSGSMADNQAKLAANFDTFLGGINDTLERLESIHVGVIATDAYAHNTSECQALGGLVVSTGGPGSSNRSCGPYADGNAFMTEADALDSTFPCAARVGTDGSGTEQLLGGAIAAITPPLTDPGACNEGFVRDGALLVLVLVTDEDAEIQPDFAASLLSSYKNSSDLVVVALANPTDGECGVDALSFGLESFVALFEHGFMGPICADDYDQVFADAVEVVAEACPGS